VSSRSARYPTISPQLTSLAWRYSGHRGCVAGWIRMIHASRPHGERVFVPQVASIRSRRSVSCKRRRLRCRRHRGRRSRTAVASTSDPGEGVDVSDLVRPGILKRLARSPACHFVVVGILLFLADGVWSRLCATSAARTIVLTGADVRRLRRSFEQQFGRAPNPREEAALVDHAIDEEVLYRRALELGLERDADRYRRAETITFTQVYLDPARRGARLEADTARILAALRSGRPAEGAGDPFLLGSTFTRRSQAEIRRLVGDRVADWTAQATLGDWLGPVRSTYGVHL